VTGLSPDRANRRGTCSASRLGPPHSVPAAWQADATTVSAASGHGLSSHVSSAVAADRTGAAAAAACGWLLPPSLPHRVAAAPCPMIPSTSQRHLRAVAHTHKVGWLSLLPPARRAPPRVEQTLPCTSRPSTRSPWLSSHSITLLFFRLAHSSDSGLLEKTVFSLLGLGNSSCRPTQAWLPLQIAYPSQKDRYRHAITRSKPVPSQVSLWSDLAQSCEYCLLGW
jgi:hypothetical protein